MKKIHAVGAAATLGLLGLAAPALAAPAETSATWSQDCNAVRLSSTKDISNIVYRVDGTDVKVEFAGRQDTVFLPVNASDVWIKSGNNHSGDGNGFGDHFARPERCGGDHAEPIDGSLR